MLEILACWKFSHIASVSKEKEYKDNQVGEWDTDSHIGLCQGGSSGRNGHLENALLHIVFTVT